MNNTAVNPLNSTATSALAPDTLDQPATATGIPSSVISSAVTAATAQGAATATAPSSLATLLGASAITAGPEASTATVANAAANATTQTQGSLDQVLNLIVGNAVDPVGGLVDITV